MARIVKLRDLPIVEPQAGDTVAAYRNGGIVRLPAGGGGSGDAVTSVGVSMPTGFAVANSPVTSSGTITVTFASGYGLPTTAKQGQWDTAYSWGNHALAGYALASSLATVATTGSYNDLSNKPALGTAAAANIGDFATAAQGAKADTALQPAAIGVTVQGYSAILNGTTASFTTALKNKLDGIAAGATANTGTVTSVGVSVPTGLSVSGSPVTSSGTIAISLASGYSIPTTAKQGQWDHAYGWGNHASAGYALSSSLAIVATTGNYNDLSNKPTIPTLPATVSQAEAEAGTATTVRGWTSQRVRQNVAAYTYDKDTIDSKIDAGGITASEIKTLYESNPNTNAFTDADKSKLESVGTMAFRDLTISTNPPSGTVPGQVWFQVES